MLEKLEVYAVLLKKKNLQNKPKSSCTAELVPPPAPVFHKHTGCKNIQQLGMYASTYRRRHKPGVCSGNQF